MQYTVNGFSQELLCEMGLDVQDAIILRWFVDFYHTGKMAKINDDGKEYAWVNYGYVIDELPILGINTPKNIGRHFQKMVDCGLMEHYTKRNLTGAMACFRLVEAQYDKLVSHGTQKSLGIGQESPLPPDKIVPSNSSISNPSFTNSSNNTAQAPLSPTSQLNDSLDFGDDANMSKPKKDDVAPRVDKKISKKEAKQEYRNKPENKAIHDAIYNPILDEVKGFGNYIKEHEATWAAVDMVKNKASALNIDPLEAANGMIAAFARLRKNGNSFWSECTPTRFKTGFESIWAEYQHPSGGKQSAPSTRNGMTTASKYAGKMTIV